MNKINKENRVLLEVLINIFTVDNCKLKVLLLRKKDDPYKGYWMMPSRIVEKDETLEDTLNLLEQQLAFSPQFTEQNGAFSSLSRYPNDRVVAISYIGFVDSKTYDIKNVDSCELEKEWFAINEIPKMAYDHREILDASTNKLKVKLSNTSVLKGLFPSDFTLPELQSIYESVMNIHLDRRNFRKKFMNLGLLEDTGYKSKGGNGRPAKLYKFKDDSEDVDLF